MYGVLHILLASSALLLTSAAEAPECDLGIFVSSPASRLASTSQMLTTARQARREGWALQGAARWRDQAYLQYFGEDQGVETLVTLQPRTSEVHILARGAQNDAVRRIAASHGDPVRVSAEEQVWTVVDPNGQVVGWWRLRSTGYADFYELEYLTRR